MANIIRSLRSNWQYRILAVILAVFTWYLVSGQDKIESWIEIPVEMVNLPQSLIIVEGMPNSINVRIRGTRGPMRTFKEKQIAYALDLKDLQQGVNHISIDSEAIPVPGILEVIEIRPARLELQVERIVSRQIPVEVEIAGEIHPDYELIRTFVQPGAVKTRGPETIVSSLEHLNTRNVRLGSGQPKNWEGTVGLDLPQGVEAEPAEVFVRLFFKPRTRNIWVKLPVKVQAPGHLQVNLVDKDIRLHLSLPVSFLRNENWRDQLEASLKIKPDLPAGTHHLDPSVRMPFWSRILEKRPAKVTLEISRTRP